ncbi:MoaD/ThiS family protein [Corynebacterium poyangense]|uniref:MoaD/ThiS family protein n=1 Tax=Corynebacterium poyangense TaxID=2684405 RepID=A0A7H0SLE3_9CORY|nr:MoaD/ThiS family protein [Corynebacterium poyangense]MBZ8177461.1 MoaD/ThiS family protein [Corynebacterium poyangense]QNQ89368.1 MoaD/ThiS family protein [Corynebacterium poyangense]
MEIHYFAAARAARGKSMEQRDRVPETLEELLAELRAEAPQENSSEEMGLADVLEQCSFLLDGEKAQLHAGLAGVKRVDILPPFAGG